MSKADIIELEGRVTEAIKGAKFIVKLDNDMNVTCTLSGRLRSNNIRVIEGDKVTVELSPYDLTQGRISWRYKD